ncbi:lysozyme [Salmonella enterica]|nr:lysozyme [Salmonella enterica]
MGINALAHATNGDYDGAANEFLKWDHASGQVVPGLTRRRSAERCLFLS